MFVCCVFVVVVAVAVDVAVVVMIILVIIVVIFTSLLLSLLLTSLSLTYCSHFYCQQCYYCHCCQHRVYIMLTHTPVWKLVHRSYVTKAVDRDNDRVHVSGSLVHRFRTKQYASLKATCMTPTVLH